MRTLGYVIGSVLRVLIVVVVILAVAWFLWNFILVPGWDIIQAVAANWQNGAKALVPTPTPYVPPVAPTAPAPTSVPPYVPPPAPQPTPAAGPAPATTPSYGLPPQPYVPHPSSYQETGHTGSDAEKTQNWNIPVLAGTVLVYGGYTVNGESGGAYGAIAGPTTATITVTDGFYSVVTTEWSQQEYCFRLSQAIQYGWAHAHLHPLSGWSCK